MSPVLKAFVFDRDPDFVVRVPHFRPPLPEEGILIFLPQFPGLFSFVQLRVLRGERIRGQKNLTLPDHSPILTPSAKGASSPRKGPCPPSLDFSKANEPSFSLTSCGLQACT